MITNPVVAGILLGTGFGFTGVPLPRMLSETLGLMSQAAVPLSLIVLGMGLAEYGVSEGWRESVALAALKLAGLSVHRVRNRAPHRPAAARDAGRW